MPALVAFAFALLRRLCCGLLLAVLAASWPLCAAGAADAPYVTTPDNVVEAMLKIAAVNENDYLMDLGSGDGRIVITAARLLGARGEGVELDPDLVRVAIHEAERQRVASRVSFHSDDLFFADLSKATVLTLYLGAAVNQRLKPLLFKLKPGTRVVSHDFDMGNWKPDAQVTVAVPGKGYGPPRSQIYLWLVPADFSGTWRWQHGDGVPHEMVLAQTYQMLAGQGSIAQRPVEMSAIEVSGDSVRFVMAAGGMQREYRGRISGDTISGTAVTIGAAAGGDAGMPWHAMRSARGTMNIEAEAQTFGSGISNKEKQ